MYNLRTQEMKMGRTDPQRKKARRADLAHEVDVVEEPVVPGLRGAALPGRAVQVARDLRADIAAPAVRPGAAPVEAAVSVDDPTTARTVAARRGQPGEASAVALGWG